MSVGGYGTLAREHCAYVAMPVAEGSPGGRAGRALSIPHGTAGVGYGSRAAALKGAGAHGRNKLPRRQRARWRMEQ